VGVTVDNGLESATKPNAYIYYGPIDITDINPNYGPVAGGTVVEIKGDFPESIPKLTLQEMTQAYCESMPIYDKTNPNPASTVTLKDARNGQRYDIRRLQDGNCWMIDNLKLELTSGMELTPADTNVVNNTTVWFTDDGTASGAQLDNMTGNFTTSKQLTIDGTNTYSTNTDAWRQVNPSNEDKCKNNVSNISGVPYAYDPTSETGCGYLYNRYTATAGTKAAIGSDGSQAVDSICPAGWRLPSATSTSTGPGTGTVYDFADLTVLNASMNTNVRTTPGVTTNTYQANWWPIGSFRGSLAGYYLNGSFAQQGTMGQLWPATRVGTPGWARVAGFNASVINLANTGGDAGFTGNSVRCVTNNGSTAYNPIADNPLYDNIIVTFDGTPATGVSVSGDRSTITATTPAHASGYVDVVVDNGFTSDTLDNGFVYYNPLVVDKIEPNHGLADGDTLVTITGSGFESPTASAISVKFDGADATIVGTPTDTEIVVKTPAHGAGLVDVTVDNGLTSGIMDDGYLYYEELKITSIDPNHGLTDGGTTVTITGTNFNTPILPAPTTMQEMTLDYCAALPIYPAAGSTIELTDTRNGQKYDIRHLQDGKCWMIDNLKLELGVSNADSTLDTNILEPTNTNVSTATNVYFTKDGTASGERLGGMPTGSNFTTSSHLTRSGSTGSADLNYDAWRQVDPSNTAYCLGDTADTITGKKLNEIGTKTGCGYLYNYYTATAGSAAQADFGNGKGAGYIAQESICPAGWHLPSGYNSAADINNDFPFLNAKMSNPNATSGSIASQPTNWYPTGSFRGIPSGDWFAALRNQGGRIILQTSSVRTDDSAYVLQFYSGTAKPGNDYFDRYLGFGMRCATSYASPAVPTVTIGGTAATVVSSSNTEIVIETPTHAAGLVNVTVSNGLSSDTLPAVYINPSGNLTDPANVASGYLYEELYINLGLNSNLVEIGGSSGLIPTANGTFDTGSNTLTTATNNPLGYSLSISTDQPSNDANAKDLKHLSLNQYITGTSNTCTWNNTNKLLTNTSTVLANNTWGFTLDSTNLALQQLCQVPANDSLLTIKATSTANESGDPTNVYFGVKVDITRPSGKYRTTVVYTAVAGT
jgi:hypothetical protein